MPAGPDAVPADGLAVHAAEETRKQRAYLSGTFGAPVWGEHDAVTPAKLQESC